MTPEELEKELDKWGNAVAEVNAKRQSRKWDALPSDFERGAVRRLFEDMKWRFGKHNIKSRITAGKAQTFEELLTAIYVAYLEDKKRE